ncbi:MAG: hypothetical protein OHK0012_04750 [Synechococcales cyanobacterium]
MMAMTLQNLYEDLNTYAVGIALVMLITPWLIWVLCDLIPGEWEEPWVLSANLALAVVALLMWAGYLAYATNTAGWAKVVQEANVLLLIAPPYYVLTSLWVSRQRLPLAEIPFFRSLQGVMIMAAVYMVFSAILARSRIIFFSYVPFSQILWLLALLLLVGYIGYRRLVGDPPRRNR